MFNVDFDQCLYCGSTNLVWTPQPEQNRTAHICQKCGEVSRVLQRGEKPWNGGWKTDLEGKSYFRMPPYPGVDYLE